ncbi:putative fatty-acid--CoA ligase [Gordonia araii NBRC 100433]|uniref:Putative fatty-acid--CoA ligase n=1 Tax=Gordonia araii NBRC 100433 TaxID=1073574 RepID=G7H6V8_9ACTN|nr:acyl-CoA synthetase [Gordonia araii]NNG96000.1 acyl-CoA synthetase [Gordonia araii NBRC 100433]GAB11583.1 putative fatty-acid--CoA ligase [Gordonia araii NBRC 100433]
MPSLRTTMEQVSDVFGAVKVLTNAGAIDLKKPKHVVETVKLGKQIGPVSTVIGQNAAEFPNQPALVDEAGSLTYAELDARANAIANKLHADGIKQGDVVGILARDHRGLLTLIAGTGRAGVRLAMMNTGFGKPQFDEVAKREGLKAIFHDEEFTDIVDSFPADKRYLTWQDSKKKPPKGVQVLEEIVTSGDTSLPPRPKEFAGFIILTSGTTGLPKGAKRSKISPFASALIFDRIPVPQRKAVVIVSPIFHATGWALWSVSTALGDTAVLLRRFDPEKTLKAIADNKAEMLVAVPTMLYRILALGDDVIKKYDTSSLKTVVVAGSALPPALCERWQDTFGETLYNLYGSTEVAIAAVAQPQDLRKSPGAIGKPPVSSYLRLYDDNEKQIKATNTPGRLFVRNGAPFEGYTDGRNKQIIDGFMSTGDMAFVDDDGLWHIAGRDDDMIVSGGENVYPQEVENLLAAHDGVADIAVIGVDDEEFGTRLRAFIVAEEGANPTADEIKSHVREHLARYKVPRDVVFVDQLPRNPTGKLVRRELPTGPLG